MSLDQIKANQEHPCHGLLDTTLSTIKYLEGSWQYQVFNNLDELRKTLAGKLSDSDLAEFDRQMELFIKNPLRRQIGRLRAITRSLDEINRYLR